MERRRAPGTGRRFGTTTTTTSWARPPRDSRPAEDALDPLTVPVPSLVVLIGAAGAGKTTLAARLFEPGEILSSDELREVLSGDAADQTRTRTAFAILHREVGRRLVAGRLVVVDATNVERWARAGLLRLSSAARLPAYAIALAPTAAVVHARNAARPGRVVPAEVVDRHLGRLALLGDTAHAIADNLLAEGFADVRVLNTPADVDAFAIRRLTTG